jgi:thiosulfate dehydrogenase [quinone] large subunit
MATRNQLNTEIFGNRVRFDYSETWVGYSLFVMRIVMGWVLFQGGVTKLVTYLDGNPANNWTAAGFLVGAIPDGNPFAGLFAAMAGEE